MEFIAWQCPRADGSDILLVQMLMMALGALLIAASLARLKIRGALGRPMGMPVTPIQRACSFAVGAILFYQGLKLFLLC